MCTSCRLTILSKKIQAGLQCSRANRSYIGPRGFALCCLVRDPMASLQVVRLVCKRIKFPKYWELRAN